MKKKFILGIATVAAASIVPFGLALASHGADDPAGHVRQEDRQQDNNQVTAPSTGTPATTAEDDLANVNDDKDDDNVAPPVDTATITLDAAKATADTALPGKTFAKAELENEDGVLVWSIRFTDGSRVDVNATDGSVTRVKDKASDNNQGENEDGDDDGDNSGHGNSNDD